MPSLDLEEDVLRALAADSFIAAGAAVRLRAGAKSLLVRIARSGDLVARERSLRVLGHRREDDEVLMEATVSSHAELRRAAMTALAQIHATESSEDQVNLCDEEWRRLRRLDLAPQPSELFPAVTGALRVGDVVRLADEAAERWSGAGARRSSSARSLWVSATMELTSMQSRSPTYSRAAAAILILGAGRRKERHGDGRSPHVATDRRDSGHRRLSQ